MPRASYHPALFFLLLSLLSGGGKLLTGHALAAEAKKPEASLRCSQRSGFFDRPFALELTSTIPGATIYFTTNGALPHERTGARYVGAIPINHTTILRATAFVEGRPTSSAVARTYLFPADVVKQTGLGFPSVWGTNQGKAVPGD